MTAWNPRPPLGHWLRSLQSAGNGVSEISNMEQLVAAIFRLLTGKPVSGSAVMIWYLLYPFRGTTEPPTLGPSHPLRKAFTDYGREAARHPVITLLISVALSVSLIYPFPFLYTNNFSNGASNLPHHVWTSAQPYDGDLTTPVDIVMRSVWVHGSYMKALEPEVLLAALDIQNDLLGPTVNFNPNRTLSSSLDDIDSVTSLTPDARDSFHAIRGLSNQSWFFHSPLLYWSCSRQAIEEDKDIIATVNAHSKKTTSVNVTLRHPIVFSGKRFEGNRLVAADALVITLVHKLDSPVGRHWERQAEELATRAAGKWRLYPQDGHAWASQLYEFRFQPLSFQDDLFLGIAYTLTTIYFILSLKRLRALKSRVGLTITVITHMAISIMSSFTVCAILKIDLSKIPREAYPLVVLAISLENMFRLINAVIVTPSENSTASRIAEALGQTGHIALAGVGQNLFILWALAKVVSPGVAAFCVFAGVALTFDFLYLLTFFVAVLSVDVRRLELSDSLTRAELRRKERQPEKILDKSTWADAMLRGELPISTRIAGTVVMVGFVLVAQWHFFENETPLRIFLRLLRLGRSEPSSALSASAGSSLDVNQVRSPTSWLRLQDHETAREVIKIIKPNAHSYVARVYDPLIFVLDGANRTPSRDGIRPFLPAVYDFIKNQSAPFFMTVLFAVALVSLLMNYLLWDQEDSHGNHSDHPEADSVLAVKTLNKGHALDVVRLTASQDGVIVSVGLDRWIRVWDIRHQTKSHMVDTHNGVDPFPVLELAIDESAKWLAILSSTGRVMLWDISARQWGPSVGVEVRGRPPVSFFFQKQKSDGIPPLVLVRSNGLLSEIHLSDTAEPQVQDLQVCKSPLVYARQFWDRGTSGNVPPILRIATTSRRGCVHIASQLAEGWVSDGIDDIFPPQEDQHVISVIPLQRIRALLSIRENSVDLLNMETLKVLHSFGDIKCQPNTIRCFHSVKRKPTSASIGLASFSLIYNDRETDMVVLRTFTPKEDGDVICIGEQKCLTDGTCSSWTDAIEQVYRMQSPGSWDVLPEGVVIGVRKRPPRRPSSRDSSSRDGISNSSLRRRGSPSNQSIASFVRAEEDDAWEVWMLSAKGDRATVPIYEGGFDQSLLVSSCGPMTKVSQQSMAVGFGNDIKIITVGNERFASVDDLTEDISLAMAGRRRKGPGSGKRTTGFL